MPKWFKLYLIWAIAVFLIVFFKGWSNDNTTHLLILIYFGLTLLYVKIRKKSINKEQSKKFFIRFSVFNAAIVEGLYMITRPVFSSLLVTSNTSIGQAFGNYFIDLLFTVPAYFIIFRVVWFIINKYEYNVWQFAALMALGQSIGDGSRAFILAPGLLLFIPYVMINYHAMNIAPYISVKNNITAKSASHSKFKKIFLPLFLIPFTYIACGLVIYTVAAIFGFK